MASGAEDGIEVRIHEETHDSSHCYRCVDVSAAFVGGGLYTDDDCDDFHHDNNECE
ncbi:MAG TPA: hypothetical protein VEF35_03785 [Candidatus Bathyarchaeia archaeon]|nr:hypothetical protein [Candidatus Bathyarchaeia archaeon]